MPEQLLTDELIEQVYQAAVSQNRRPSELVEEAVVRYLATERLEQFAKRIGAKADAIGLREEDVPALVEEVRREKNGRAV